MAIIVNNQDITIGEQDGPQVWQGTIANNAEDFFASAQRLPNPTPFPPEENRITSIEVDYSTDGGVNWINIGGGIFGDAVENSMEVGGCTISATIPRSPGRRLRTTVTRLGGVLKYRVFAEIT